MSNTELIANLSIFSDILQDHLLEIAQNMEVFDCEEGKVVFQEGDPANLLYGVVEGEVELVLVVKDSIQRTEVEYEEYARTETETVEREIVVDSVGAGEIFGWSAMTPSAQFTSKAICVEPSKLVALPAESLRVFFSKYPHMGYQFMERLTDVVSKRLANRTDKLLDGWSQAFSVNRI